jgi:hypothetical protein
VDLKLLTGHAAKIISSLADHHFRRKWVVMPNRTPDDWRVELHQPQISHGNGFELFTDVVAKVVGERVWLDVSPSRQPSLAALLWAFIGTSGAVSGSIRAAASTRLERIPPTRALNIALFPPPTFSPLDFINARNHHHKSRHWHCQ